MTLMNSLPSGQLSGHLHIDERTFILWEPCSGSHGEIVPGYAKYFLNLGYKVLVLVTPERFKEGLFCRFANRDLIFATLSQQQIRRFVKRKITHKAAGVIVTTAGKLPKLPGGGYDLEKVFGSKIPEKLLLVDHDAREQIDGGLWNPDTITLKTLVPETIPSQVVNPHYFGCVEVTRKNPQKTIFLMVGAARSKRRNDNLVFNAVERLLREGIDDFEVRLVGKPGSVQIPTSMLSHIIEVGKVSFSQLYEEVENSDFILTAFQRDNVDHAFYRTTGTTGSFQLAYGFCKPAIVQERFVAGSMLNGENSLLYDDDAEVFDALKMAIQMSAVDYRVMQAAMKQSADLLYQQSLSNLKELIDD